MQRFRIDVSYDGTNYAGWQIQPGDPTVQQQLESVITRLTGEHRRIHGSGRTDQGVHARGQVAHFDLNRVFVPDALRKAFNALLPADIRVVKASIVDRSFDARRSATSKEYRYFICNTDTASPFTRRYRAHIRRRLNVTAMRQAAGQLEGCHDFAAFTANSKRGMESTVRSLHSLRVLKRGGEIVIVARGEGFLYKMVRSLAGWLIGVGEGRTAAEDTLEILQSARRTGLVHTAPPEGLFLWRVFYD